MPATTYVTIELATVSAITIDTATGVIVEGTGVWKGSNGGKLQQNGWNNGEPVWVLLATKTAWVPMTDEQFVRFKNAGKRHGSKVTGKMWGVQQRERADRTDKDLHKWDVGRYNELQDYQGGWGPGQITQRDHMTADSSNQLRVDPARKPGDKTNPAVQGQGLAITVSRKHHTKGSFTYGGRTAKKVGTTGLTRTEYGAKFPAQSLLLEFDAMLDYKRSHDKRDIIQNNIINKNTLRVEMVGAYSYFYRVLVRVGFPSTSFPQLTKLTPSREMDLLILNYLYVAVNNDTLGQNGQYARF